MEFSKKYQIKIDDILSFLFHYDTLDYDQYKQTVFNKNDEPLDYWLCESSECVNSSMKNLRKELPKNTRLFSEMQSNDGDNDKFECCTNCGKPLNKYLTWYEDELNYLIQEIKIKEDLIEESNCFKVVGLLESTGWLCDSLNSKEAKEKLLLFIDKISSFIKQLNTNN